ncbi:major coat protein [Thermus phage Zuza8]
MKQVLVRALPVIAALGVAAFAQTPDFDPGQIAEGVRTYILGIAAAGVGVLVLTVGLSAAWRYAKRFLKG